MPPWVRRGGGAISAAHHTLPLPSYAEVTDLKTGRTILVRVERRGPGDSQHAIELSPGAAAQLGIAAGSNEGVRVRRVNPPEQDRALLRSGNPAPERMATPKPLLDVLQRKLDPALAQKALDAEDRDPIPAKPASVVKPANVEPPVKPATALAPAKTKPARGAASKSPKLEAVALTTGPATPPKGYVPSVPARQAAAHTPDKVSPKIGADFAQSDADHGHDAPATAPAATKAKPAKTPPAKPAEDKPDHAAPSGGSFVVQAGAYSDKKNAETVANKIGGAISASGKVWRVRVGPFSGHASAEAALAKVKSAGYSDARIQRGE
ncbi:SPOR domain-containing protein [Novosphingobium sp.]|uniref:SPOR domain-containing protein n=1 Tax=Novosphingobium sp. TaxID=1874826 RepID=UPI0031E1ADB0